ncbi:MAG: tetratricopeptide repeat protein [Spirochaetia bacterium]|jgi:tetratricopeptide (TPR) repeat protein
MLLPIFRRRGPAERIETSFRWLEEKPLPAGQGPHYAAFYERGSYTLTLARENYFAWETLFPERRFSELVLEAEVELGASNGHCAAGLLFRHVNDENFYSFLVSSRGNFRVDLLFNNHPRHLVEWTRLPAVDPELRTRGEARGGGARTLRVVANGARFTFIVDDEWVGEVEDDVLPSGGIGFAAQNFTGSPAGAFHLRRLMVEARPMAAEKEHLRWSYYAPVSPVARLRLAETLLASGEHNASAVQLRKALKDREGSAREHFLLAESYLGLSLYDDALAELQRVIALEPKHAEALAERANVLYLSNRVLEARDCLAAGLSDGSIAAGAGALNLLGNAEYALGNWQKAADAYRRAADIQPDTPLFLRNAARSLERAGMAVEAVDSYLRAARLLFAEESFDELSLVVPRVRALAPENPEVRALEAKMLYREGKHEEAFAILADLYGRGTSDASVHYLLGILHREKGSRADALPLLQAAADLEPSFPLYQFRLAETLHLLGRDPGPVTEQALTLAPDDPWTNNLAGQLRMEAGDCPAAVTFLSRANAAAPGEQDISLNLSEALSLCGRHDDALAVLARHVAASADNGRLANQRGNILVRQGEHARAVAEYEAAIRFEPENATYKENCAAACLEVDMIHRAEELLSQVEPGHPSPSVYNLLGNVAVLKGERARAEAAYNAGLALDRGNADLAVNLALLHRERGNHVKAKELLLDVLVATPGHARARKLLDRIRDEREKMISCAVCGRQWWVERDLPPQPPLRIRGEPPAEAPAGRCPHCGKVYCVSCASAHVREMRFFCPDCNETLKLSEDSLKWLLARALWEHPSP